MTDQPSQPPPDEPATEASVAKPSAPAPESWGPGPEPAFGTTEPGPTPYEGEGGPAARLAAVFGADHPERAVGAAFAGGLVLALILRRLAH